MSCSGNDRSTRASPSISPRAGEVADAGVEQDDLRDRQADGGLQLADVLFGIHCCRRRRFAPLTEERDACCQRLRLLAA